MSDVPQEHIDAMWGVANAAYSTHLKRLKGDTRPRSALGQFVEQTVTRTTALMTAISTLSDAQQAEWRDLMQQKQRAKAQVEAESKRTGRAQRRIVQEPQNDAECAIACAWNDADTCLFEWQKCALTRKAIEAGYIAAEEMLT